MELFGTRADVTRFLNKSLCAVDAQKLFKTEVYQLMAKEILSSAEPRIFLRMLACPRKSGGIIQHGFVSSPLRMVDLFCSIGVRCDSVITAA